MPQHSWCDMAGNGTQGSGHAEQVHQSHPHSYRSSLQSFIRTQPCGCIDYCLPHAYTLHYTAAVEIT